MPGWCQIAVQCSTNSWLCAHVNSVVQLGPKEEREGSSGCVGAYFSISWFYMLYSHACKLGKYGGNMKIHWKFSKILPQLPFWLWNLFFLSGLKYDMSNVCALNICLIKGGPCQKCLKISTLTPMGSSLQGLPMRDPSLSPPSNWVEIIRYFWNQPPSISQMFRVQTSLVSYFRPDRQKE